jgi:hypothetical protein
MPTEHELERAARLLASSLSPQQATAMLAANYNTYLWEQEEAKTHPFENFVMPADDWQLQKAHMMDGGGVVDDGELSVEIMTAMLNDDQATFWPDLIHVFKSWQKIQGRMVGMPGGGMFLRGVPVP